MRDAESILAQGIARPLIQLRWARSRKIAGYYDPAQHALIYQDARGRVVDRIDLPSSRTALAEPLTNRVE